MAIHSTLTSYQRFSLVSGMDWKLFAQKNHLDIHEIQDIYPVTPFQKSLLYIASKSQPPGRFFTEMYQIGLPPFTDVMHLKEIWGELVKKHAILRTGFLLDDMNDDILAIVYHPDRTSQPDIWHERLDTVDLEKWSMEAISLNISAKAAFAPFSGQPPYAVHVVGSPQVGYHLHLCLNHALFDGATIKQLLISFHSHYHRGLGHISDSPSYALIASKMLEREKSVIQAAITHYRQVLDGLPTANWPLKGSTTGATESIISHCPSSAGVNKPAFPANIVRVALALSMSLHSSQSDHIFCETRSSRSLLPPDLQGAMGPVLYSHLVRIKSDDSSKLETLLDLAKDDSDSTRVVRSATLSLGEILEGLDASTASKLRVFLTVYASPFWPEDADIAGWSLLNHKAHHDAPLNIDVFAPHLGVAQIRIRYDPALSENNNIEAFCEHFVGALKLISEAFITGEYTSMIVHDILERLQSSENARTLSYGAGKSSSTPQLLVNELFEACVQANPSRIALDFEGSVTMSYMELDSLSTALAMELRGRGVKPEILVPLMFNESFEMIIAILAVLKSGGAYVPLDVNHPRARLEKILCAADAKLMIYGEGKDISSKVAEMKETYPVISALKYHRGNFATTPRNLSRQSIGSQNLAYVFFTSGSTGAPKGVAVEHGNLAAFLHMGQGNATSFPNMRKLLISPYTFDVSVGEIFSTLTSGGTLSVVSRTKLLSNLPFWVEKMRSTHIALTPSVGRHFPVDGLPDLQHILFVGETLPVDLAFNMSRNRTVSNMMGPTETVVDATEYIIPKGSPLVFGQRVPIGYPIGQTVIYVLRPSTNDLVAVDEVGEICIGGPQVSRGYLGDDELSRAKFVADPFSTIPGARMFRTADLGRWNRFGQLEHFGRLDGQVKLRGLRIETGEVETVVMRASTDIRGVYVDVLDFRGEMALIAVLEQVTSDTDPVGLTTITEAAVLETVKSACTKFLPSYMKPSIWLSIHQFPLNSSGKLERKALREVVQEHLSRSSAGTQPLPIAFRPPESEGETLILGIASRILNIPQDQVMLDLSFINHGGNSLQAMKLAAHLQSDGSTVTVIECLDESKSLAMLAGFPRRTVTADSEASETYHRFSLAPRNWENAVISIGLEIDEVEDVHPIQTSAQDWLDLAFNNEGRAMLLEFQYDLGSDIDASRFKWAWEQLRLREPALRTVFVRGDNSKDLNRPALPRNNFTAVVLKPTAESRGAGIDVLSAPNTETMQSMVVELLAQRQVEIGKVPIHSWLIFNEATKKWLLVHSRHHVLHDARTLALLGDELSDLYAKGERALAQIESKRSVKNSFGAFMLSITRPALTVKQEAFWRGYLEGAGPAVWPSPSHVPLTFCKDFTTYGIHVGQWVGSLQDLAKASGVTKGAVARGAFGMGIAEKEEREETLIFEFTDGMADSKLNPWGYCTDFKPTKIQSHASLKPEGNRFLAVVRDANKSYVETMPNIGLSWDISVDILGPKVSAGNNFVTSCLNIFDTTVGLQKDVHDEAPAPQLLANLLQQMWVGVYLPLYIETRIMNDLVILACPYDPTVVKKEEAEALVARMVEFFDTLKAA
ncbi:putative nonribosomal peptide synthetase, partial [Mycena floridula]